MDLSKYVEVFWLTALKMVQEEFNCLANSVHKVGLTINGRKTEFKESKENRNALEIVEEFA
jgi:hypothetical protein